MYWNGRNKIPNIEIILYMMSISRMKIPMCHWMMTNNRNKVTMSKNNCRWTIRWELLKLRNSKYHPTNQKRSPFIHQNNSKYILLVNEKRIQLNEKIFVFIIGKHSVLVVQTKNMLLTINAVFQFPIFFHPVFRCSFHFPIDKIIMHTAHNTTNM